MGCSGGCSSREELYSEPVQVPKEEKTQGKEEHSKPHIETTVLTKSHDASYVEENITSPTNSLGNEGINISRN
jgi:hypothetical protein